MKPCARFHVALQALGRDCGVLSRGSRSSLLGVACRRLPGPDEAQEGTRVSRVRVQLDIPGTPCQLLKV